MDVRDQRGRRSSTRGLHAAAGRRAGAAECVQRATVQCQTEGSTRILGGPNRTRCSSCRCHARVTTDPQTLNFGHCRPQGLARIAGMSSASQSGPDSTHDMIGRTGISQSRSRAKGRPHQHTPAWCRHTAGRVRLAPHMASSSCVCVKPLVAARDSASRRERTLKQAAAGSTPGPGAALAAPRWQ
jgi:hypothetical protein